MGGDRQSAKAKAVFKMQAAFPMVSERDLSQARVIVAYAPLSADAVLDGTKKFSEAFVQAQRMKGEQTADDEVAGDIGLFKNPMVLRPREDPSYL